MVYCLLTVKYIGLLLDDFMSDYAIYFRLETLSRVKPHCTTSTSANIKIDYCNSFTFCLVTKYLLQILL